jgi:transketolase
VVYLQPTVGKITMTVQTLDDIRALGQQLRVDSIRCSTAAGSGHPTSSMSAADLMAVLLARHFRYDWQRPRDPANDHLIFSKRHASPLLYSMFKAAGVVSDEELMTGYRRFGSVLEGHPTPVLPWVDVATGSLGQGLPDGVGVALAGRYLDELPYRVWVLCGDSEMAEGSMWEALDKAASLICLVILGYPEFAGAGWGSGSRLGGVAWACRWKPAPSAAPRARCGRLAGAVQVVVTCWSRCAARGSGGRAVAACPSGRWPPRGARGGEGAARRLGARRERVLRGVDPVLDRSRPEA